MLEHLDSQPNTILEIVLVQKSANCIGNAAKHASSKFNGSRFLWQLFHKYRIKGKSRALQQVVSPPILDKVPTQCFELKVQQNGFYEPDSDTIANIASFKLDFIINFSNYRFNGDILKDVKYGVWYYAFGDPEKYSGNLPGLWEIYNNDRITRACLLKFSGDPTKRDILREGYLKTNITIAATLDNIYLESAKWPLLISKVLPKKPEQFSCESIRIKTHAYEGVPGNFQLLKLGLIQFIGFCKKAYKSLFITDYWNIGVAKIPIQDFLNPEIVPEINWYNRLPPARFIADPFALFDKGKLQIVYEDFQFREGIGKIASVSFSNDSFEEQRIVIDENFHMSYPFLITYDNAFYCIPETYQKNQVRLYKAESFPHSWKLEKVLIDNYAGIDSTVFKYKNIWYLFSTNKHAGAHYNLNIHYSNSIFGPWQEHPKNPVKTDIRSVRPAGTIFMHQGDIYRPSMDYSEKVEGRIAINKIIALSTVDFREQIHTYVDPFSNTYYSDKVHTLCQVGPYTLIDGAKELFVLNNPYALKYKIKKIINKIRLK